MPICTVKYVADTRGRADYAARPFRLSHGTHVYRLDREALVILIRDASMALNAFDNCQPWKHPPKGETHEA